MRGTASQLLRGRGAQQANGVDDLHPFVQTLSLVDLESCLALENACFEEHERESRKTVRKAISFIFLSSIAFCGRSLPRTEQACSTVPPFSYQTLQDLYRNKTSIRPADRQKHARSKSLDCIKSNSISSH